MYDGGAVTEGERSLVANRAVVLLVAALAIVLVGGPFPAALAINPAALAQSNAAHAALVELERQHGELAQSALATRFDGTSAWETGTVALPATDAAGEVVSPDEPRVFLYVAKRTAAGWSAALEGTPDFRLLAEQGSAALAGTIAGDLLATTTPLGSPSSDSAALSLPWRAGKTWRLTGGPHSHTGRNAKPWSALDFAGPRSGMSVKVLAARDGIVLRPCRNLVQIRHSDGWTTSYYHLKTIAVRAGQRVARGQQIGYTSTAAGCGGRATGPHVHFSVLRYGGYVDLDGFSIGGWRIRAAAYQYGGCMAKGTAVECASSGRIYNTGSIGTRR